MQLNSRTLTLITIIVSICVAYTLTNILWKTYFLNSLSQDPSEENQYSPESNYILTHQLLPALVCVAWMHMNIAGKTYILNGWSGDQRVENQNGPQCYFIVKH
jgi:hypothetical protein